MLELPNLPHPDVPVGPDDSREPRRARRRARRRRSTSRRMPHWDLGTALGIIDFERGVKISGSRFYVLQGRRARGCSARSSRGCSTCTSREHGYVEIYPPAMVKARVPRRHRATCPKFARQPVPRRRGGLLVGADRRGAGHEPLPRRDPRRRDAADPATSPTRPCFRREKMSAGRDVRGIKRGHQFDKVEMVKFVRPETSDAELRALLDDAEDVCRRLGLPLPRRRRCAPATCRFTAAHEVRRRGVGARLRRVARGELVLELPRLPGAAREHPLPPGAEGASPSSCTR